MRLKYLLIPLLISAFVMPITAAAKGDRIKSAFGVNVHLRERVAEADWDTVMEKVAATGAQWGREQFNWDVIEASDGDYDWDTYDSIVQAYQDHDINMVGLLTYSSSWASSNPGSANSEFYPPDMDAWEDYVGKVAEHYAGSVDYWEIWNEPNHDGFWKGSMKDYAAYYSAAVDEIRDANPDAKIILGGLSGADADWLDGFLSEIDDASDIEVVAIHPYRTIDGNFNYTPERAAPSLNPLFVDIYNVKAVLNRHGFEDAPIWITEAGWTTYNAGVTNKEQAQFMMRFYTIALSIPDVAKVFWYTMADASSDESYFESQFGLLNHEYEPKLSYHAYKYMKEHLYRQRYQDQDLPNRKIVDNFIHSAGWEFTGTKDADGVLDDDYHSKMKVYYNFTGAGNCYIPIVLNRELPGKARALQFRAKGSNDDTTLRLRLTDSKGETFQYTLGYMPSEWLNYSIQVKEYNEHWGGNNDGKLDYPLSFNSFILDDNDGSKAQGYVYFDELYSSNRSYTYLYRFHQGHYDMYAYWNAKHSQSTLVNLTGAGRIDVYRWRKSLKNKTSGNGDYYLKANKSIRYLQTK